jgi:hypothetical protein
MAGIRPFRSPHGGHEVTLSFPITASEDFDAGDPVYLASSLLTEPPQDGTEVLVAEFAGFAAQSVFPGIAATTTLAGNSGADVANEFRSMILPVQGQTFITANFWTATSVLGHNRPIGTDIGALRQLAYNSGAGGAATEWGVEDGAATIANEPAALIVAIYTDRSGATITDADVVKPDGLIGPGEMIDAANTTTGIWVEFMMMGSSQLTSVALGTA